MDTHTGIREAGPPALRCSSSKVNVSCSGYGEAFQDAWTELIESMKSKLCLYGFWSSLRGEMMQEGKEASKQQARRGRSRYKSHKYTSDSCTFHNNSNYLQGGGCFFKNGSSLDTNNVATDKTWCQMHCKDLLTWLKSKHKTIRVLLTKVQSKCSFWC